MDSIKVNFAKHQKLPKGFEIEWWEADEMYHWIDHNKKDVSIPFCTRWKAYRSAWRQSKL